MNRNRTCQKYTLTIQKEEVKKVEEKIVKLIKMVSDDDGILASYMEGILLDRDFSFDSLMIIELITSIEEEFNIEFDFDEFDIEEIYNLDKIIENVEKYVNEK